MNHRKFQKILLSALCSNSSIKKFHRKQQFFEWQAFLKDEFSVVNATHIQVCITSNVWKKRTSKAEASKCFISTKLVVVVNATIFFFFLHHCCTWVCVWTHSHIFIHDWKFSSLSPNMNGWDELGDRDGGLWCLLPSHPNIANLF